MHSTTLPPLRASDINGLQLYRRERFSNFGRLEPKLDPTPLRERAFCQSADHVSRRRIGRFGHLRVIAPQHRGIVAATFGDDIRQFAAWGNTDPGRHVLIAVARYLAAHSPTERAALQTADIAQRLMRGGELYKEGEAS